MKKFTPFIVFLTLLMTACNHEDQFQDHQAITSVAETMPQPSIHPSLAESTWWKNLPSFTREMHTIELASEKNPITLAEFKVIEQQKIRVVKEMHNSVRKPKVSPGYPTPNPEGNVVLNSQADVDAFGAQKYKEITGHLEIDDTGSSDPICDLSPLKRIRTVGSYLIISASCVTDLDGLKKINSVGILGPFGYIAVRCENVTDITGISGINTITGSINIINNFNLTSIGSAFNNITTIESGKTTATINSLYVLNMFGNTILTDLGGLGNLTTIERNFLFRENDALTNLDGFTALNSIGNFIAIEDNASLQNVNKLSVISSISSVLLVDSNPSLTQCCGLYNLVCSNPPLCTIPGALFVQITNNGAGCTEADILFNGPC